MNENVRQICKVLVAGAVGVGKTTAVRSVSDVPVLTTEARPTDETRLQKASTTVAMDFGVLQLNRTQTIHLQGTPGQQQFDCRCGYWSNGTEKPLPHMPYDHAPLTRQPEMSACVQKS